MTIGLLGQLGLFAGSAAISVVLVPLAIRVAVNRGWLDNPGGRKRHQQATPYLGGVAILLAFSTTVLLAMAIWPPRSNAEELVVILAGAVVLSLFGLWDDLRAGGLPVWVRLGAMTGAAGALYAVGVHIQVFDIAAVNLLLTVVWVLGITNAMNLLDNMDGLSAGIAAIAALWFFVIAVATGQFLVAALAAALAGCAVGFLRHNSHPARIYMGDAGSLFLGFMLAAIGIKLRFPAPENVSAFVPPLVLAVPITDTALVVVSRLRNGRSPFKGGRDHLSHRLVRLGLPVPVAVRSLYVAALLTGWTGLIMHRQDQTTAWMLAGLVVAAMTLVAVLLSRVPAYDLPDDQPYRLVKLPPGSQDGDLPAGAARRPDPTGRSSEGPTE